MIHEILYSWAIAGILTTSILLFLLTEGGTQKSGFKPQAYIISCILWPIMLGLIGKLVLNKVKVRNNHK